jgi:hypothetical protein
MLWALDRVKNLRQSFQSCVLHQCQDHQQSFDMVVRKQGTAFSFIDPGLNLPHSLLSKQERQVSMTEHRCDMRFNGDNGGSLEFQWRYNGGWGSKEINGDKGNSMENGDSLKNVDSIWRLSMEIHRDLEI